MTFQRIRELVDLLPDTSHYFQEALSYAPQVDAINKFLCAYKDLQFCYNFVKALVKDDLDFPAAVHEPLLYDLYLFEKYGRADNQDLVFALSIPHPSNRTMESTLKAFLVSDASMKELEAATGIPERVLHTYEQLFFNIRDRKQESLFIANLVYPDTRMVEAMDGYVKNEDAGRLLMRSAYNNGLEDAAYFAGLKLDSLLTAGVSAVDMATRLECAIMSNGYFLARNGFLNQRGSGVSNAKGLLIAAKQGGQDSTVQDSEGIASLGENVMQVLLDVHRPGMESQIQAIAEMEESKVLLKTGGENATDKG